MLCGAYVVDLALCLLFEKDPSNHPCHVTAPRKRCRLILCLNGQNHFFAHKRATDTVIEFQRHELKSHRREGGGGTHDGKIIIRRCHEHILVLRLVDAVIVRRTQHLVLGGIPKTGRGLLDGLLLVVVNTAGGKEDIVLSVFQKKLVIIRKSVFSIIHKIDDTVKFFF